ncbi:MAG: DUF4286 family protein [Ginsengibacter sp.]|jgi:quinol monooxygenase YgiN
MYTVNITTKVDNDILADWLKWQKEMHIPTLMETGCFRKYRFHQLLGQDETDGKVFVLQLIANTKESNQTFIDKFENKLKNESFLKWGEKCFEFRSLLQNID